MRVVSRCNGDILVSALCSIVAGLHNVFMNLNIQFWFQSFVVQRWCWFYKGQFDYFTQSAASVAPKVMSSPGIKALLMHLLRSGLNTGQIHHQRRCLNTQTDFLSWDWKWSIAVAQRVMLGECKPFLRNSRRNSIMAKCFSV